MLRRHFSWSLQVRFCTSFCGSQGKCMSYQAIGLLIIFLAGCICSCFPSLQSQSKLPPLLENTKKPTTETFGFERASALLDSGQGDSSSKMFHEVLQTDIKEKSSRVAVDLNNEAVALYLSARNQTDSSRVPELLLLSRDCLAAAQKCAQEANLSQTRLAVLYNQAMLLELVGDQSKSNRVLAIASRQRRNLKPRFPYGLLP